MKQRITHLLGITLIASMGIANATTITVTTAASTGAGSLNAAIAALNDNDTIAFNIPGTGPFYITPPVGGFPIITKNGITIDGYTQPGSSVNTGTILGANNAVIQIVIKGSDDGTEANRHFSNLTDAGMTGFTDGEEAILAFNGASGITVRGLCFEGDWADGSGQKVPPYGFESEYGIALGGDATSADCHISGCRFGLDPDGVTVRRLKDGIAWFGGGVDNLTIGVAAGPNNAAAARAQFNIFVGMYISAIGDHGPVRISGNFFNVYPDGNHDYNVNTDDGSLGHSMEAFTEQNAAATDILIGTDGDGNNDAEERNVFGGVTLAGDNRILEWYSGAPSSYVIAGNYFGMGVDGVTRFTNGGPVMELVETFKGGASVPARFGSDFNGVSDALEGNVVSWNYPFDALFPNPAAPGFNNKFRFANIDQGDVLSVRGNSFVGMESPPYTYCWTAFGLANYSNRVAQFMVPPGDYNTFYPQVDVSSTSTNLIGSCPPGLSPYDQALVIDVYKADPEGWANGKKFGLAPLVINGVTNGFAEGKTYVGSLRDNGPYDLDPTVGSWRFNVGPGGANLGLAPGDFVTVTANYSDTPLTGTAVGATGAAVHTSNFSKPVTLQVPHRIILVTTTASSGAGSLTQAILDAAASADPINTIAFNIPGTGPFRIAPPVGGFPLVTKANTIIDGYSQPGSSVNTAPITDTNNAKIQIVLDARSGNFRDMAYVYYGSSGGVSSPPIDNSSMANPGSTDKNTRERGGYDPADNGLDVGTAGYAIGERAILGIYRAKNVWVKGLAFLSDGQANDYAIAIALDYGLDTSVRDRWDYPAGTCRGVHISGCWIGVDPVTGSTANASSAAITAYRHRDKSTGGTRPDLTNLEDGTIGVAAGSPNPRAEFNVLATIPGNNGFLGFEASRYRISGNQFLGQDGTDLGGRIDDPQTVPAVIIGTDGDGVNDADEGNLWPEATLSLYHTANRYYVVAGNIFGLARDGSRPKTIAYAVDAWNMNEQSRIRFGSDFNGVSDAAEANTLYDTLGFAGTQNAPTNASWILQRGNVLVNNSIGLPMDEAMGLNTYNKFIDTTAPNPITPVITAATTTTLSGTCGIPLPGVAKVVVDIYLADPEGDLLSVPQGKTYLTSREVANPSSGAFSFTGLTLTSGKKVTIAVNYLKSTAAPTLASVSHLAGNTTLMFTGGNAPYNILQASAVGGPYKGIATVAGSPATFADAADNSFYRTTSLSGGGQTSPFATSFLVP
jgi:hypothetical protein